MTSRAPECIAWRRGIGGWGGVCPCAGQIARRMPVRQASSRTALPAPGWRDLAAVLIGIIHAFGILIFPKITLVLVFLVMAVVLVIGVGIILWSWKLWPFNSALQTTNNSYIRGQTTILSSQVNGYVTSVRVKDFDEVKRVGY